LHSNAPYLFLRKECYFYADYECIFIDGSYVRAHQHATGIKDQAISKSIRSNRSKIHLAVDAYGNPIEFIINLSSMK